MQVLTNLNFTLYIFGFCCSQIQSIAFAVKGASVVSCASNLLKVTRFCSLPIPATDVRIKLFIASLPVLENRYGTALPALASIRWVVMTKIQWRILRK